MSLNLFSEHPSAPPVGSRFDPSRLHVGAALRLGLTRGAIVETFIRVGFTAGIPAALLAIQTAKDVFASVASTEPGA
ncbi:carboxymuconolactone decarboxylase family protein [Trinickia dabaoshanensis]|uniref:carboxymuconolactone decarboxylase family protein n=1 Tax=Trinickia dabaoshanensis TaxID=564714 RepID=UPI0011AF04CA|nr:hypothetical protein [Trinickia dabaoshanensis]